MGQWLSKTPLEWTSSHQQVLEMLLDKLVRPPVMAYPGYSQPFVLQHRCFAGWVGSSYIPKAKKQTCGNCLRFQIPITSGKELFLAFWETGDFGIQMVHVREV